MPGATEIAQTVPIGYLLIAIGALTGALVVVFWQLIAAKNETVALAKEVIPVATILSTVAGNLQRLIEREHERRPPGGSP